MIVHIALFKWKPTATSEQIDSALQQVKNLKNCEGIVDILVGKNYHHESKGLTHGVVVLASSQQALDGYRKHPDHATVAHLIESIEEDGLGFDFEDS